MEGKELGLVRVNGNVFRDLGRENADVERRKVAQARAQAESTITSSMSTLRLSMTQECQRAQVTITVGFELAIPGS